MVIDLPSGYTAGRIGVDYSQEQIVACLSEIGCDVEKTENGYSVTVPSWRTDLLAKEDLTEEIARIDGYDKIPSSLPVAPAGLKFLRTRLFQRMKTPAGLHLWRGSRLLRCVW